VRRRVTWDLRDRRGRNSNLRPLSYELAGYRLPQYIRFHYCSSATFSHPTCLASSLLFASVSPCSVAIRHLAAQRSAHVFHEQDEVKLVSEAWLELRDEVNVELASFGGLGMYK
jgi:hypothetical protein